MSTQEKGVMIYPDESTQKLMEQLVEDEQALTQAADEFNKWQEKVERLSRQVEALRQAIEIRA